MWDCPLRHVTSEYQLRERLLSSRAILIVDTKKVLFETIRDYFAQRNHLYRVYWSLSVSEALEMATQEPIDILYAEHTGPGFIDGLEMARTIQRKELSTRVVLGVEPGLSGDRVKALEYGCDSFLIRPIDVDGLCSLLFNMLHPKQGFRGRLIGMRLEDIIQMFCYGKDSILLTVLNGREQGLIYIHQGDVIHAECSDQHGVDAFYEILGWKNGEFLSQVVLNVPDRTVYMDWQSLLMEGIRERDEIRHALGPEDTQTFDPEAIRAMAHEDLEIAAAGSSTEPQRETKIMVVDDSRLIRKIVQEILEADAGISIAGYAVNGVEALEKLNDVAPDLILLDWDMPVMKGSTALMHIMIRSPGPVVILSGFVGGVGANPFDLICLGAADFMRKPQSKWRTDGRAEDLIRRIKRASEIRFERIRRVQVPPVIPGKEFAEPAPFKAPAKFLTVLCSSMGGCADLIRIIPALKPDLPSAVVCLHDMQKEAIGAFVDYLNNRSVIQVRNAESDQTLENGVCYLHPAISALKLAQGARGPTLSVETDVPSANVLSHFLDSAVQTMGNNILAVLLSGGPDMRVDGLSAIKKSGGKTMAQDPATSVDPRLAQAGLDQGVVDHTCPADDVVDTLIGLIP